MLAYTMNFDEPIGICQAAVLLAFQQERIKKIEVFHDGRPFADYVE
ncbi:MAG: hypothetical protein AAGA27_03845 [Pseudomonadota bacterium]